MPQGADAYETYRLDLAHASEKHPLCFVLYLLQQEISVESMIFQSVLCMRLCPHLPPYGTGEGEGGVLAGLVDTLLVQVPDVELHRGMVPCW